MSSKEYINIDVDNVNQELQDECTGQRTIELNIQKLSKNQIKFLKNFVDNPAV